MNKMPGKRIFFNFSFLTVGKIIGDFFTLLVFVLISRYFGPNGLGIYTYAIGLTGFFAILCDYGLNPYTIKELGRKRDDIQRDFGQILTLRLCLTSLVILLVIFVTPFLPFPGEERAIIVIVGIYQALYRVLFGFSALFIAIEDAKYSAFFEITTRFGIATVTTFMIIWNRSLSEVLLAMPIVCFIQIITAYVVTTRKYGRLIFEANINKLFMLLKRSLPYAMSIGLNQLYTRTDVVMLGIILGASAVGIYNAPYRIVFFAGFITQYAAWSIFPNASRLALSSAEELQKLFQKALSIFILLLFPLVFSVFFLASDIIAILFGSNFNASISILKTLCFLILLSGVVKVLGTFLMACDMQVQRVKYMFFASIINVIFNLVLITYTGILGAAVSALLSEIFLIIMYCSRLKKIVDIKKVAQRIICVGSASLAIGLVYFILFEYSNIIKLFISSIIYTLSLFAFNDIRKNELYFVKSLIVRI